MRFAHFGDTHIRNLKYHKEYRVVFEQMYKKLRRLKPDAIVHCGDIAHTKTQISPEFVQMCSDFFKNLADIAPTYIILGNHDGNLKNSSRLDSISPIVESLDHANLHLLREAQEVVLNEQFALNALSIFDEDNWVEPSDLDRVNIALYHGCIKGAMTDINFLLDHGDHPIDIFEGFDFAFLGDIHRTNQILDTEGRVRYCGSTVQQNFAESDDKGFLIWDIDSKENFKVKHYAFKNPKPFVTIELDSKGKISNDLQIPPDARIRLIASYSLTLEKMRRAIDVCKTRFKPESVTFVNKGDVEPSAEEITDHIIHEDLRDISVQEEIIEEFLKDYQTEPETLKEVFSLNKRYNVAAEQTEEVVRNVKWKLKKFKWDNLFNYGAKNEINFTRLRGLVGIFGKNYSGKSSIVDGLLYTVFNTTSKNNRKNLNVINQNEDSCYGKVEIDIGKDTYTIVRESEKYRKKLRGKETVEAKTDVSFSKKNKTTREVIEMNGIDRNETDKNIRRAFGDIDEFLLTSLASQLGSLSFIGEGSTKRKEILAKFLDLDIFDKKFKLAKEDSADIKGALNKLKDHDFIGELAEAKSHLTYSEIELDRKKQQVENLKDRAKSLKETMEEISGKLDSSQQELLSIKDITRDLQLVESKISSIKKSNYDLEESVQNDEQVLVKIEEHLQKIDIDSYEEKLQEIDVKLRELSSLEKEIELLEQKETTEANKVKLLSEVPCGSEFSHCKFIKDAYQAKESLGAIRVQAKDLTISKTVISEEVDSLEPDAVKTYLKKYNDLIKKRKEVTERSGESKILLEKNKSSLLDAMRSHNDLQEKKKKYEDNEESIKQLETIVQTKDKVQEDISLNEEDLAAAQEELLLLFKNHGSLEQKVKNLEDRQEELDALQKEYTSYELYLKCMHSNGISYDIIKKRLPIINEEVSKILANIVNFEVFFEEDGRKLDIMIKHPKFEPRPIEMGSGAEKTIASMAIRLALIKISTLPVGDVFILDEPATALDEEHMEGFVRLLEMIKSEFKTVLLISHLDTLKDVVDKQIIIEKDHDGYAHTSF
tara:strand:- start:4220 stop:7372 length:3153 start_codon:yes stop_codon:yes gene_type:complete